MKIKSIIASLFSLLIFTFSAIPAQAANLSFDLTCVLNTLANSGSCEAGPSYGTISLEELDGADAGKIALTVDLGFPDTQKFIDLVLNYGGSATTITAEDGTVSLNGNSFSITPYTGLFDVHGDGAQTTGAYTTIISGDQPLAVSDFDVEDTLGNVKAAIHIQAIGSETGGDCDGSGTKPACVPGMPGIGSLKIGSGIILPVYYTVSGTVTEDGSPFGGVEVNLEIDGGAPTQTTTAGDGTYSFSGVLQGSDVKVYPTTLDTHTFAPTERTANNLVADLPNQDFAATLIAYKVCGTVRLANLEQTPVEGATVKNETTDEEVISGIDGQYCFETVPPGDYVITAMKEGFYVNPGQRDVTVVDQDVLDQDFFLTPVLESPVISLWTGFIETVNIAELSNLGDKKVNVTIKLYNNQGLRNGEPPSSQVTFQIKPKSQRDVIINDLGGFEKDRYGFLQIEFDRNTVAGRTFYYRESQGALGIAAEPKDDFEYVYPVQMSNYKNGGKNTYIMFNTFNPTLNPTETFHTVGSWITLGNLDPEDRQTFTINGYLADGTLFKTFDIQLRPYQRVDTFGFHEPNNPGHNNIGQVEIIPHGTGKYFAITHRYGTTSPTGEFPHTWRFAVSFESREAETHSQFLSINSELGTGNMIELANPLATPSTTKLEFFDSKGVKVSTKNVTLPPHNVKHIFASGTLVPGDNGIVKITPEAGSAFFAYSITYRNNANNGRIDAVDVSQTDEPFGVVAVGNYNLFLEQQNPLRVMNVSDNEIEIKLDVLDPAGNVISSRLETMDANSTKIFDLADSGSYGTLADTNSTFNITAPPGTVFAEMLRVKPYSSGIDFSATTLTSPAPN